MNDDRETVGEAVIAMVFAVLSWCGLWFVGGLLTWAFSNSAYRKLDRYPDRYKGWDLARSARTVAALNFVVFLVPVAAGVTYGLASGARL